MMAELRTGYLGLELRNPLVASSSPLTGSLDALRCLEDHGIGAVVLPSLFEEDIDRELAEAEAFCHVGGGVAEVCGSYLPEAALRAGTAERYLDLVQRASAAVGVPVIASLNGVSNTGWTDVARLLEQAGAAAIELNLYDLPLDLTVSGAEVEDRAQALVRRVRHAVSLPIAVKLNPYFSAFGAVARSLHAAGANGLVLFNRPYLPDIDLLRLRPHHDAALSHRSEMRLPRTWISVLHGRIDVSLAASTGVESADDVVRYLLAGADVVMSASALLRHGPEYTATLVEGLAEWLDARGFSGIAEVRGLLRAGNGDATADARAFYRAELKAYYG